MVTNLPIFFHQREKKGSGSNEFSSLGHHDLDELVEVDAPVAVHVGLADHLVDLGVGQPLAEVGHHVPELGGRDEAVLVLVEHAERLPELLLRVAVLHPARHQVQELREVDGAVAVGVHLGDHVLQLRLRGVLAQGPHHGPQLLGGDATWAFWTTYGLIT
jgi:hypothetical protein